MKNIKVYLKVILKFFLVLLSIVGVSVLGYLVKDLSKNKKKKSGEQLILLLLKTKEEALENPEGVRSRILKKYNNIRFYSYITLFLMYAILFLCPIEYVVPYIVYIL